MTTSSAETELLEASEGALLMYSIDALLSDVGTTLVPPRSGSCELTTRQL